ncbi:unnamed protein product [Adineta steineri]|uniref:Uncharacterized protein n=2 Tax=Adineta steineri TaxID=433720 RepID=A0A813R5C5_9BILA|nr:unnamed protein product [Adineta steineri]
MELASLLVLLTSFIILDGHYFVYYSDDRYEVNATFDCLYAYSGDLSADTTLVSTVDYSLIPYCRRFDETEEEENFATISYENILNNMTFTELYRQGITSTQLLAWSVPIDIIERYEKNGQNSNEIFHNCSLPWFGSTCQYRFESAILPSFNEVLQFHYSTNGIPQIYVYSNTCYPFLPDCYRGPSPMCLDWHEICDGYFDCLNGEDEQLCDTLEVNECFEDEFRCHFGGQCISSAFLRDGKASTDCLDGSDEVYPIKYSRYVTDYLCTLISTFQCEELNDRRPIVLFPCRIYGFTSASVWTESTTENTQVCAYNRYYHMFFNDLSSLDHISDVSCRQAIYCSLRFYTILDFGYEDTSHIPCEFLGNHCQSEWLVLPKSPLIYGLFQFVYLTNRSVDVFKYNITPDLICFNASRCPALVYCSIDIGMHNGLTCCKMTNLINRTLMLWFQLDEILIDLGQRCLTIGTDQTCSHSSLFHCSRSLKCISKHRLVDGYNDCYFKEDELFPACQLNDSKRFICTSNPEKCLSLVAIENGIKDCEYGDDEWSENRRDIRSNTVPFAIFCDGETDLLLKDTLNHTDETNCERWPCNNPYFRCDNAWHCLNGVDELNCPNAKCSLNEHLCIHDNFHSLCLPYLHLMDRLFKSRNTLFRHVYFANRTDSYLTNSLLWNETKCITSDHLINPLLVPSIVHDDNCFIQTEIPPAFKISTLLQVPKVCRLTGLADFKREPKQFLQTFRLSYFPSTSVNSSALQPSQVDVNKSSPMIRRERDWYCNRGIPLLFKNNHTKKCLCPPSYFGHRCHLQSQRISLTLQLIYRTITDNIHSFQLVIMLIDDQETIYPYHEQITFVPKRDCQKKFNIYLLYPHRPKNLSSNYSIRIDIFNKITLTYWASWHLLIPFQFLPVNRIATQLFIPTNTQKFESSCSLSCGKHGRCMRYVNKNSSYFCQCDQGYSGRHCNIQHSCSCSSDSFCLTSSICLCAMKKFGRNCSLTRSACQSLNNSCENNGLCIPVDDRININDFTCLCKENFYGKRCENQIEDGIYIELNEEMIQQVSIVFIHFIKAFDHSEHQHITEIKKIKYGENTIQIHVKQQFHILFIELLKSDYYLIIKQQTIQKLNQIQMKLSSNQQCVSIHELMNSTLKSYTYLHRIKYYPLLCRQYKELMCFYDETYMCICDLDRFSNCFIFNHSLTYDCQGHNYCENNAQCFQDNPKCPVESLCICSDCYYGLRCQFTTEGFALSLDYILSYHIKPNLSFSQQPMIIKISIGITTIMFILGLINGIMSILTFHMKKTRDVGCGYYLLVSSWISICLIIMLIIKFWQLLLTQMVILTNRSFINVNCILLDMIIKILIAFNDWLDTCVSIERAMNVSKGVKFNKNKSKQISKWVVLSILTVTILTHLHDPIHRQLIDDIDIDEKRIWCLVQYSSSSISTWNSFITFVHFLMPFLINLLSIIFIIISIARSRSNLQTRLPFIDHLRSQLKQQKSHLIASCVFISIALIRLFLSFTSGCMKSPNNSWLFLIAYFISFLPSMMTFIVYILPSKVYKKEFNTVVDRTVQRFRTVA